MPKRNEDMSPPEISGPQRPSHQPMADARGAVADGRAAPSAEGEHSDQDRGAQLARANRALRDTVNSLRATDDLDSFLGLSLKLMAEQIGSRVGMVFVLADHDSLRLAWLLEDRTLIKGQEAPPAFPYGREPMRPAQFRRRWAELGYTADFPRVLVTPDPGWNEEQRAYLRARGVGAMVTVPMVLDGDIVGSFALGVEVGRDLSADDRELVQTLPNQAALAIKLARLADNARRAATAQQQEQAARLRAESAAAWRQRVGRVIEHLAASPDIDASLGLMLAEVVQQLRAAGGGIWRAEANGVVRLVLSVEEGEVRQADTSHHPGLRAAVPGPWMVFGPNGGAIQVDDESAIAARPEYAPFRQYLAERRIRTVVGVPMFLREAFRGGLSLRFTEQRTLTAEEREFLQTCASQAALMMELTRLSRAARAAAVSEERNRLARDIHDTVAQGLASIVWQLEAAATVGVGASATRHISLATQIARENLVEARRSIQALRPTSFDGRRLKGALDNLVERCRRLSPAPIQWRATGDPADTSDEVEDELFRIAQEALTNAIKHANARAIEVILSSERGAVSLSVRDDGVGFDATRVKPGVGLSSMHQRADRIGAMVTVASEPGKGTEVAVSWSAAS